MRIKLKRVYDNPDSADGTRILVDRLWPRGLSKRKAKLDLWLKEIAPSSEVRKWFGHDKKKWREFRARYRRELRQHKAEIELIKEKARAGSVTLVYGARDQKHNQAVVIKELLERR